MKLFRHALSAALISVMLQSACFADSKFTAVAAGAATDFSSGAHTTITGEKPRTMTENLVPSGSDLTVVSKGRYFYRMERSGANNITKFDINEPEKPLWQYSTEGSETGSNPHDLIFATDSLAYLLRYGSSQAWLIDASASKEENFLKGSIDLSSYADKDGKPEMNSGVMVGNRLFVTLQRIDFSGGWGKYVYNQAYVAVFDASTGKEIDTKKGGAGLKGIALPLENPGAIQFVSSTGMIYVQCFGQYNKNYTGGIAMIDPDNYESAVLVDDGPGIGAVTGMVIVSPYKGYFVGYSGWGNNNLFKFNPASLTSAPVSVPGFEGKNISGLEPSSLDGKGMVWVGTSDLNPATYNLDNPSIKVLDSGTDQIDEAFSTKLVAQKIVFCDGIPGGSSGSSEGSGCFISSSLMPGGQMAGSVFLIGIAFFAAFSSFLTGKRNK